MAITILGSRGTVSEKVSSASLSLLFTTGMTVGNYALAAIVIDNVGTAEGQTNTVSVSGDIGNGALAWFKLREQTEANTAALTGVTCALFMAAVGITFGPSARTVDFLFSANSTAKGAGAVEISVAAGKILTLSSGGANGSNGAAATSYSVALSGLSSVAGLYLGMSAAEDELDTAVTLDAGYGEIGFGSIGSGTVGGNQTNVRARVGTLANTSTGDTFDNTGLTVDDRATILVRLQEDDLDLRRQKPLEALQAVNTAAVW